MFNHIMVGSNDIERSKTFYDAVLGTLGAGEPMRNVTDSGVTRLFYLHDGGTFGISEPLNGEGGDGRERRDHRLQVRHARAGEGVPRCRGRQWRHFHRGPSGSARNDDGTDAPVLCARSRRQQALRPSSSGLMETVSTWKAHGGTQGVYRHRSNVTGTDMTFAVFVPPHEKGRAGCRCSGTCPA